MSLDNPRFYPDPPSNRIDQPVSQDVPRDEKGEDTGRTTDREHDEQPEQPPVPDVNPVVAFYRDKAFPRPPQFSQPSPSSEQPDDTSQPKRIILGETLPLDDKTEDSSQEDEDDNSQPPKEEGDATSDQHTEKPAKEEREDHPVDQFLHAMGRATLSDIRLGEVVSVPETTDKEQEDQADAYDRLRQLHEDDPAMAARVMNMLDILGKNNMTPDTIHALIDSYQARKESDEASPAEQAAADAKADEQPQNDDSKDTPEPKDSDTDDKKDDEPYKVNLIKEKYAAENQENAKEEPEEEREIPKDSDELPRAALPDEAADKKDAKTTDPAQQATKNDDEYIQGVVVDRRNANDADEAAKEEPPETRVISFSDASTILEDFRNTGKVVLPWEKEEQDGKQPEAPAANTRAYDGDTRPGMPASTEASPHAPTAPDFKIHEPSKENTPPLPDHLRQPGTATREIESSDPSHLKVAYDAIARVLGETTTKIKEHLPTPKNIDEKFILSRCVPLITGMDANQLPIALVKEEAGEPQHNEFVTKTVAEQTAMTQVKSPAQSRYYLVHGTTGQRTLLGGRKDPVQLWKPVVETGGVAIVKMIEDTRDRIEKRARNHGDLEAATAVHNLYAQIITLAKMFLASR